MKKIIAMLLAAMMILGLCACTVEQNDGNDIEITLWTYPIGNWGDQKTVEGLIAGFEAANPGIKVKVEYLTYANGDDTVNAALEGGKAPDLIMEGPERLVTNWGAKGKMVDLSDLWTDAVKAGTYASVEAACKLNGKYYEYPVCMTAHCMAINKTVFEAADALKYIDVENHTWTTENFIKAVEAVYAHTGKTVGAVYCKGQGGDQGTRALVNNMYGGTYTNADYTAYTWDSAENIQALNKLVEMEGIKFDASLDGGAEANEFAKGNLAMAFCWNGATHANNLDIIGDNFEVLPMAFPSENGNDVQLCGGIWGFGIFDNGNAEKIAAAKKFIKYMADENTKAAVEASGFWSTRKSVTGLYAGDELKAVYGSFMQYMGNYYNVVPGWAAQRAEWYTMLQKIGEGGDVAAMVAQYLANANAAAKGN